MRERVSVREDQEEQHVYPGSLLFCWVIFTYQLVGLFACLLGR